jgi:uncharacterized integral membrane protein
MQPGFPSGTSQWDAYVDDFRTKLPVAPLGLTTFYVRWAPWVAIVFGAIGLFLLLIVSIIGVAFLPFLAMAGAEGISAGGSALVALVVGIAIAALELVGGYLMLKRSLTGWWILGLSIALGAINNLFHVAILGLLISLAIAYVHIQVKPQYK